jgi:hypothetical protein
VGMVEVHNRIRKGSCAGWLLRKLSRQKEQRGFENLKKCHEVPEQRGKAYI